MRKLLAILLLAIFAAPVAQALLAAVHTGDDANLPACCRRLGEHHCTLTAEQRAALTLLEATFSANTGACPYSAGLTSAVPVPVFTPSAATASLIAIHVAAFLQPTGTPARITAPTRLHPQRGPPTPPL